LRIDFEQHEPAWLTRRIIVTEICARGAAAAECLMRGDGKLHGLRERILVNGSGQHVAGPAFGIFAVVIIKCMGRGDIGDGQRACAHDTDGEFAAGHEFLDQGLPAETPFTHDFVPPVRALA